MLAGKREPAANDYTKSVRWPWFVIIAACGRVGFAPHGDAAGGDDGNGDGTVPANFCATVPMALLCSDFEENQPIQAGWTRTTLEGNGTIVLSDLGNSSAHAITAAYPDQSSAADLSVAYLQYDGPALAQSAALSFDILIPARPVDKDYEVCDVAVQVGGTQFANDLDITASGSDAYREEENTTSTTVSHLTRFPPLSINTWHRIAISIDVAAQTYSFEVDHVVISAGPTTYPITAGAVRFEGGLDFAAGILTGNSFELDNIVIDAN
jgi:hypothetical protein